MAIEKQCPKCNKTFKVKPSFDRVIHCSKKCSMLGRKTSLKQKEAAKKAMTGNKYKLGISPWNKGLKGFMVNENNGMWRDDAVSYSALHHWVNRHLGKVQECGYCGNEGRIEWASISHQAKRDLEDYIPLCVPCHRDYDKKVRI